MVVCAWPGMKKQHWSLFHDAEPQFDKHRTCSRRSLSSGASNIRHFQTEKMLNYSGSPICSHTGTCSSPNLEKKWRAGYELHLNHFKPTNPSRLPFEPPQSWELDNILTVYYPSPELETQSCHLPTHLPSTQGWGGQDYPATSLTAPLAHENEPSHAMAWKRLLIGLAENKWF